MKFLEDLANISITVSFHFFLFSLKVNGQHSGINVGPISRLVFKYEKAAPSSLAIDNKIFFQPLLKQHQKLSFMTTILSPLWAAGRIFNWEQRQTVSLSFASCHSHAKWVLFYFPCFAKLISMLLLLACVNYSRMHAIVASRVTGLGSDRAGRWV